MRAPRRVVLASGNPGKLREFRQMTAGLGFEIVPQREFGVADAEEHGASFAENALLKARHAAARTGLPAIADDSGIEVDALGGEPGIRSARYAGPGASDAQNLRLLLDRIARTGAVRPAARFRCAMACVESEDDPEPLVVQASWEGFIVSAPRGDNGFGYDPIFHVPAFGCTSAELPPEVKNRISHRGQAMALLAGRLEAKLGRCTGAAA